MLQRPNPCLQLPRNNLKQMPSLNQPGRGRQPHEACSLISPEVAIEAQCEVAEEEVLPAAEVVTATPRYYLNRLLAYPPYLEEGPFLVGEGRGVVLEALIRRPGRLLLPISAAEMREETMRGVERDFGVLAEGVEVAACVGVRG